MAKMQPNFLQMTVKTLPNPTPAPCSKPHLLCLSHGLLPWYLSAAYVKSRMCIFNYPCTFSTCTELQKSSQFSSVQFSHSVVSDSLRPHEPQRARPPCPSQTPGVYSNTCPSSRWCHPAISSSVVPFSSCPQSLPASGSFPMSQLFAWGGRSTGVSASASVLPMNTQDWSALGWTTKTF